MSRLFISHSSTNNPEAAGLNLWLREQGWDDVFLDVTPDRGIAAGERWERALNEAASRCEAVLFLVSRAWLASRWCRKEFELARRLNKRLLGALIEVIPVEELPSEITETFQMVDLASGTDHRMIRAEIPRTHEEVHVTFSREGLFRLKDGLAKAGLDPRFFPWPPDSDPGRSPYRGLKPMEGEDAGVFFGRDAPIIEGLDMLRGLAEAAAPRLLVVLGASGAGKSSFLRAGLLPRLARDDRTFLALPVIRPEGGALTGETGLLPALDAALAERGIPQSRAATRTAILGGAATLKPLLARLVDRAVRSVVGRETGARPPVVTLAIDQAEELFGEGVEGEAMLALVRDLVLADDPAVIVLFTIRSDAYDALETARTLEGLRQRSLPLLPMPRGAYQTVIEGPAARLSGTTRPLAIEPRLTERLLQDIERGGGSDALPLLAFTLGQLFVDFGGGGALRLEDYETFGGLEGAIEAAVRRALAAADRDPRVPRDPAARLLLIRRGLIPWLAGIDPETGSPRRRLARFADIPADAEPLIRLLVEQRLLSVDRVTRVDDGVERSEITIEPAHEALLRQWGLLRGWLDEDFAALAVLDAAKRGARDWEANAQAPDWLNHTGSRLAETEEVAARGDLGADLNAGARAYLLACRARDDADEQERRARVENERRLAESRILLAEADAVASAEKARAASRFTRLLAAASLVVLLCILGAGGLALLNVRQGREAAEARAAALVEREAGAWLETSRTERRDGNAVAAARSALRAVSALPGEANRSALLAALLEIPTLLGTTILDGPAQALAWLPDGRLGIAAQAALLRTVRTGPESPAGAPWPSPTIEDVRAGFAIVRAIGPVGPDRMLAVLSDGSIVGWARADAGRSTLLRRPDASVAEAAAIGRTGRRIAMALGGEGAAVATCATDASRACETLRLGEAPARAVAVSPDEARIAVGLEIGEVALFDAEGREAAPAVSVGAAVTALAFSADGRRLAAGTAFGEVVVLDAATGRPLMRNAVSDRPVGALALAPDGRALAVSCGAAAACLIPLGPGEGAALVPGAALRLPGHQAVATGIAWSPDGRGIATGFADGLVRVWDRFPGDAVLLPDRPTDVLRVAARGGDLVLAGPSGIETWDSATRGSTRLTLPAGLEVRSVAPAPDGRVAAVLDDGSVAIWPKGGRGEPLRKTWDATANPGLAWLGAGRTLAVALSDGRVALLEPASGQESFLPAIGPGQDSKQDRSQDPWGLAASPDGGSLYVTYVKGEIRRWDPAAGTHVVLRSGADAPTAERGGPEGIAVSPDGRLLATTAEDDGIRLFETAGGPRSVLRTGSPQTRVAAFSPDGRRLAALGTDGMIAIWSATGTGFERTLSVPTTSGRPGTQEGRPANWIVWQGPDTLAVATAAGTVVLANLDEAGWRRRVEGLALALDPVP